ncbi:hypothetical protein GCM10023170_094720 [Phytohabitans houttuyneae]
MLIVGDRAISSLVKRWPADVKHVWVYVVLRGYFRGQASQVFEELVFVAVGLGGAGWALVGGDPVHQVDPMPLPGRDEVALYELIVQGREQVSVGG